MNASYDAIGIPRGLYPGTSNTVLVARLRGYWKEFAELPATERWYRKLADNKAGPPAWADALGNIVRKVKPSGGDTNQTGLAGETLRARKDPSVTELLVRRAATLAGSARAYDVFAVGDAVRFLLNAETWEASPLLPIASELQQKVMADYPGTDNIGSADPQKAGCIANLAMLRARHGDTRGLDDFAEWIQQANPKVLEDSALDALEPFWRFPDYPALRDAARNMFGNTNSAWGNLAWLLEGHGHLKWQKPLALPVLLIPEVCALVLSALTNRTVGGEALNRGGGNLEVTRSGAGVTYYSARKDLEGLEIGAKVVFRRCDVAAEQLAAIPGFPQISLVWPEAKRDEAVNATIKLLSSSAHRLQAREKPAHWSSAFDPPLIELKEDSK